MNYFFGLKSAVFTSEIQIPTFQNRGLKFKNISLYKALAENSKWTIKKLERNRFNDDLFYCL